MRLTSKGAVVLSGCLATSLAGCAFRQPVTGMAIEYNEFVAQATNRQTAINILRARDREPLHFTSFTKVLGTARIEGAAELGGTFNGDGGEQAPSGGGFSTTKRTLGATNWAPKLGVKVNSGTDFEIAINATDDFWKGIIGPVAPSTLVYYLNQDWPADLISHLFISRIDFVAAVKDMTDPDRKIASETILTLSNIPDEKTKIGEFTTAIRCRRLSYKLDSKPAAAVPVPDLPALSGVNPDALAKLRLPKREASDTPVPPAPKPPLEYPIPEKNEFRIALSGQLRDAAACSAMEGLLAGDFDKTAFDHAIPKALRPNKPAKAVQYAGDKGRRELSGNALLTGDIAAKDSAVGNAGAAFEYPDYFTDRLPAGFKGDLSIAVTLRSIEGVIYYLGEYIRHPDLSPKLEDPSCPENEPYCLPIIVVLPASDVAGEHFITVEFKGGSYVIPSSGKDLGPEAGRSSQVVTLVQQMLNLHRAAKDLPSTPFVRVLN